MSAGPSVLAQGQRVRDRIVEAVTAEYRKTGTAPRIRTIGSLVGLRSSQTVQHHLRQLVSEGRIRQPRPRGGYIPAPKPDVCPMCGQHRDAEVRLARSREGLLP